MKNNIVKIKNGYITLTSVLLLSAVAVIIAFTSLTLSTDSTVNNATVYNHSTARALANSCAEVAINRLKTNITYVGNENVNIAGETCTILPILGTGLNNRTIQTQATVNDSISKIEVFINTVNPNTDIDYWEEVADF